MKEIDKEDFKGRLNKLLLQVNNQVLKRILKH